MPNIEVSFANSDGSFLADGVTVYAYSTDGLNTLVDQSITGRAPADTGQGMCYFTLLQPNVQYRFNFPAVQLPDRLITMPNQLEFIAGLDSISRTTATASVSGGQISLVVDDPTAFQPLFYIQVSDGTNYVSGQIQSVTATSLNVNVITTNMAASSIMATDAIVTTGGPQGAQGVAGTNGINGTNGTSVTTTTKSNANMPSDGGSFSIAVYSTTAFAVGMYIQVSDGTNSFFGNITSINSSLGIIGGTAILTGTGGAQMHAMLEEDKGLSVQLAAGAKVSISGPRGPSGTSFADIPTVTSFSAAASGSATVNFSVDATMSQVYLYGLVNSTQSRTFVTSIPQGTNSVSVDTTGTYDAYELTGVDANNNESPPSNRLKISGGEIVWV